MTVGVCQGETVYRTVPREAVKLVDAAQFVRVPAYQRYWQIVGIVVEQTADDVRLVVYGPWSGPIRDFALIRRTPHA